MIGIAVRDHLLAGAQVQALLDDRIRMNVLRQSEIKPAAAITLVVDVPLNTLCGYAGLRNGRVQVDVYARDTAALGGYLGANAVADAIELRMREPAVFTSLLLSRAPDYDDSVQEYHVRMDFSVWSKS